MSEVDQFQLCAGIEGACPVLGEGVAHTDGVTEVMVMFRDNMFTPKVVNNEGENDRVPFLAPDNGGCPALVVLYKY